MKPNNDENLHLLVRELSKSQPNAEVIKSKTQILGIPYSDDLIILMSDVMVYLAKQPKKKSSLKEKLA